MIPWDEFWPTMLQVVIGCGLIVLLCSVFILVTIFLCERYFG